MSLLETMDFDDFFNQAFLLIESQPQAFHKFIYPSQTHLNTLLESKISLNYVPDSQLVYIVCDLYSQTNPPLLSHHTLVRRNCCDPQFLPVIGTMSPHESENEMRAYILENFHILNVAKKKREQSLISKLKYMKLWKSGREQLADEHMLAVRNSVSYGSYDMNTDGKVYLGFTAYVDDSITNGKNKYGETIFSSAIYDCSNSDMLNPFTGSRFGGSLHDLNKSISTAVNIQVILSDDNGWSALATVVHNTGDRITFRVPPYGGKWDDDDDTRLVRIKILAGDSDVIKKAIKFLYQRL